MITALFNKLCLALAIVCCMQVPNDPPAISDYDILDFKAFNGIRFQYCLLLPEMYQRDASYEIVAVLTEVHRNDKAWEKSMEQLVAIDLQNTILIVPQVPVGEDSWGTHPIHHAFNDLLKEVRKSYGQPKQKFHLVGLEAGHETAFWWTFGSANLIASTSIIKGHLWKEDRWDEKWYKNLMGSNVPIIAYEERLSSKFDMSKITLKEMTSIAQVLADIEQRGQ